MKKFNIPDPFKVPDGTLVSPFLNSNDSESGLPPGLLDGFSLAHGIIEPSVSSKIHVMPLVTQVTFVLAGEVELWMKEAQQNKPTCIQATQNEAVITRPETLLQLVNRSPEPCRVLYIVSPAYLFVMENGQVLYDDSIILEESWGELAEAGWQLQKPYDMSNLRQLRSQYGVVKATS